MYIGAIITRTLTPLIILMSIVAVLASCKQNYGSHNGDPAVKQTRIVAGYGEENFATRYNLDLDLPMPKSQFLALLSKHGLQYQSCGERDIGAGLPVPRHTPTVDLSTAKKCLEIFGDIDNVKHTGKRYRAFVNGNQEVFYIENSFSYTGP